MKVVEPTGVRLYCLDYLRCWSFDSLTGLVNECILVISAFHYVFCFLLNMLADIILLSVIINLHLVKTVIKSFITKKL